MFNATAGFCGRATSTQAFLHPPLQSRVKQQRPWCVPGAGTPQPLPLHVDIPAVNRSVRPRRDVQAARYRVFPWRAARRTVSGLRYFSSYGLRVQQYTVKRASTGSGTQLCKPGIWRPSAGSGVQRSGGVAFRTRDRDPLSRLRPVQSTSSCGKRSNCPTPCGWREVAGSCTLVRPLDKAHADNSAYFAEIQPERAKLFRIACVPPAF